MLMQKLFARGPSDEQQFETMDAGHFLYLLLESDRTNMLFRSPIQNPEVKQSGRHLLLTAD